MNQLTSLPTLLAAGAPNSGTSSPIIWVIAIVIMIVVTGIVLARRGRE